MKLLPSVYFYFALSLCLFLEVICVPVGDECFSDDDCRAKCRHFGGSSYSCSEINFPKIYCFCNELGTINRLQNARLFSPNICMHFKFFF